MNALGYFEELEEEQNPERITIAPELLARIAGRLKPPPKYCFRKETAMNDTLIPKWISAQRIDRGEWKIRFYSFTEKCPSLDDSRMLDETPIGEMKRSEFAIFRYCENWQDRRPRRLIDCRDKSNAPICGLQGLINSKSSDWF